MSQANSKKSRRNNASHEGSVEVLYQRLGGKWFAFSLIDDEVFVGTVPPEAIEPQVSDAPQRNTRTFKNEGNS